ncbi:MAG: S41 family peptidase [Candidatus Omnitrophota bacterium]
MLKRSIIFIVLGIMMLFSIYTIAFSGQEKDKKDDLYRQVELFSDTLAILKTDYVDEVVPRDLIYGALKGMLSSLDPHSQFMDPDTYNELKIDTEGKFGGLGIEITIKDGLLTVVTPIEDTPAWKAGVKSNDRIIKIDDEITRDMTLTDAVKKLRGRPGDAVNITVLRESEKSILEFEIFRDIIKIKDIKEAKILENGIAYIRLVEFRENTSRDLKGVLENLYKDGMTSLILDLRNNPGGLLDEAVKVTGKFIKKGELIVYTKGRIPSQDLKFVSESNRPILDLPMVVLINEGSASGSEIVAACLRDYKRAIILGTKSFGKGSVQTIVPLSDGSALKLTTSKYFTPSGEEIHGKGVEPDIIIQEARIEPQFDKDAEFEQSQYIFEKFEKNQPEGKEAISADYKNDNQLMRAMDVLKVVMIYKPQTENLGQ